MCMTRTIPEYDCGKFPNKMILEVSYYMTQKLTAKDAVLKWAHENYEPFFTDEKDVPYLFLYGARYVYLSHEIVKGNQEDTVIARVTLIRNEK